MGIKLKAGLWVAVLAPFLLGPVGQAEAQSWSVSQGKDKRGIYYAGGSVRNGFAVMSLNCASNNMKDMTLNLVEIPMAKSDKKDDTTLKFTLGMDHGGGLVRKVGFKAWYFDGEDTWVGKVPFFSLNELASFGQAKRFIIWDYKGREVITFSAKGSMKLEEALHGRCYT